MVKREYKMTVTGKREGTGDFREVSLAWETLPDLTTPYWLRTDPCGVPMPLHVTPEEYENINIGDTMLVVIQSDYTMPRLNGI